MKNPFIKLYITIIYVLSSTSVYSIEAPKIKNLILYKQPKKLENIEFQNVNNKVIRLSDFENKLLIVNFWATWCLPCRDEMPSLDKLANIDSLNNLQILPINVGGEDISKSESFFNEINIKYMKIYYDPDMKLPKDLLLRGLPTTLLINKNGQEFARILGSIDDQDKKFIDWLKNFD